MTEPRPTRVTFRDVAEEELPPPPAPRPRRIGAFRILRRLGEGGMGTVYEAVKDGADRRVALKVMRHGLASRSVIRRFEAEAEMLARLCHPGIARIHAAGTHVPQHGDGAPGPVPFFAMELVEEGRAITDWCAAKGLPRAERLALFVAVCEAVQHGHERGVIHRDLKPANILVDKAGRPKVIDFGVARSSGARPPASLRTEIGQIVGTVQYMSPEQCDADPSRVDARSDVYALGVVLYELLAGRLPYDVREAPLAEAARVVRDQRPDRPSTVAAELRGDLETIVLKALEKDPACRYASAGALAEDLRRFAAGRPIAARPPSRLDDLRRLARRNPGFVIGAIALIVVLLASTAALGAMYLRVEAALARIEGWSQLH